MIKIVVQGNKEQTIDFQQGMTLGDALKADNITVEKEMTLTINGKEVSGWRKMKTKLNDNDEIVVIPTPGNG